MVVLKMSLTSVHRVTKAKVAVFNTNIEMNQGETKGTVLFKNADELQNKYEQFKNDTRKLAQAARPQLSGCVAQRSVATVSAPETGQPWNSNEK